MKLYEPCCENYGVYTEGLNSLASALRIAGCPIAKIDISLDGTSACVTFAIGYQIKVNVTGGFLETMENIMQEVKKVMQGDEE